ncbi:MAG: tetratricopeptide repeat protein [Spirochaetes bacterium]|nr:tetratricopeptide repeat protein [Spirochaetota bacterium]
MQERTKKRLIIGIAGGVLALALLFGTMAVLKGGSRERNNMLTLAREYIDRESYDRALDILDALIIKDAADSEARSLRDEALDKLKAAGGTREDDTLAQSLDELGRSLERTASTVAQSAAQQGTQSTAQGSAADSSTSSQQAALAAAQQAEAARKAEEDAARKAETDALAAAEAEAAAAARAAREAELARMSEELREKMEAVTRLVQEGRTAITAGDNTSAGKSFTAATTALPPGEDRFASQTWSDIAESWYEAYKQQPSSPEGVQAVREAQRAAQEAIRKDSTAAEPHYTLSKIYNDANLPDQALSELEQAQRLDPNNYLYAYELGRAYFSVKKYEEARRAFESVTTRLNPRYEPAFFNLGTTYRVLRNNTAALAAFRGAIAIKPDYVRAHVEVGRILAAGGDTTGAIRSFNTALSFSPQDASALRELGVLYAAGGQLVNAEKAFEQALAVSADAVTYYNLAEVKYNLDKSAEALPLAQKAVQERPSSATYQYLLGLIAHKAGSVDTALAAYREAARLDVKHIQSRINLGIIYLESGFVDNALTVFDEAYKIDPKSLEANNNLANAYGKKSLFEKSVFHYEAALALAPRDITIRLNLCRAYVQAGNNEKARDGYIEVVKLDANAWDAYYELGKLYIAIGDNVNAKRTLADLLAKNPSYPARAEVNSLLSGL